MGERDDHRGRRPTGESGDDWFDVRWDEQEAPPPRRDELPARPGAARVAGAAHSPGARVSGPPTGLPLAGGAPSGQARRAEHLPSGARRYGRPVAGDAVGSRRQMPAGYVLLALVIGLLLAGLLNAEGLARAAKEQPVGARRTVLVAFTKPLTALSSALRLHKAGDLIDRALGRERAVEDVDVHRRPTPGATPSGAAQSSTSPSPNASPANKEPTAEDPLVLWVGGDSMAMVFGESLEALAEKTDVIDATLDSHVNTGLSRPDYFDWPKRLRAEMDGLRPDVAVAVFGANDWQNVEYEGQVLRRGSPEWLELYRRRTSAAMDILVGSAHRPVWWVGMPVARNAEQSAVYRALNKIYVAEAKKRPDVHYVDTYTMFCDASGRYADYLIGLSGQRELMRQGDGIHWSRAGGDLAASAVLDQIKKRWRIE